MGWCAKPSPIPVFRRLCTVYTVKCSTFPLALWANGIYDQTQSERWPIPEQNMNAVIVNMIEWMQTLNWAQWQVQSELWTDIELKMTYLLWLFRKFSPSCILTIIHGKTFGFVFVHLSKNVGFRFNQSHE